MLTYTHIFHDGDFTGEEWPAKAEGTHWALYDCGSCEEQKMCIVCGRENVLGHLAGCN